MSVAVNKLGSPSFRWKKSKKHFEVSWKFRLPLKVKSFFLWKDKTLSRNFFFSSAKNSVKIKRCTQYFWESFKLRPKKCLLDKLAFYDVRANLEIFPAAAVFEALLGENLEVVDGIPLFSLSLVELSVSSSVFLFLFLFVLVLFGSSSSSSVELTVTSRVFFGLVLCMTLLFGFSLAGEVDFLPCLGADRCFEGGGGSSSEVAVSKGSLSVSSSASSSEVTFNWRWWKEMSIVWFLFFYRVWFLFLKDSRKKGGEKSRMQYDWNHIAFVFFPPFFLK